VNEEQHVEQLVLSIIATDQPGLDEHLAKCVAAHDGNWMDSRMARLAGQFAGILRIEVPAAQQAALLTELDALKSSGIRVLVAPAGASPLGPLRAVRLDLLGNDRSGIVRDITRLLTAQRVNLESLSTEVIPAPMSGEPLFHADAALAVPEGLSLETLQEALETLADELMVELNLRSEQA